MIPRQVIDEIDEAVQLLTSCKSVDFAIVSALEDYKTALLDVNIAVKTNDSDASDAASVALAYIIVFEGVRLSDDFREEERSVLNDISFSICSYIDYLASIAGGVEDVA